MERIIESKTFNEIRPGDTAAMQRNLAATDLRAWSVPLADGSAGADGSKKGSAALVTVLLSSLAQSQLGLSGTSSDMREIENNADPRAKLAFNFFVYSIVKYAGAYITILGGLDALVFTAGIGENSAEVRSAVCEKLSWLGVSIDPAANKKNGPPILAKGSDVSVWVIPTNEELMIAMHTQALIRPNKVFR